MTNIPKEKLPKAINCRLGEEDMDIKLMLVALPPSQDKTARVKELIRKGMKYEEQGFEEYERKIRELEEKRESARRLAYRMSIRYEKQPPSEPLLLYTKRR